MRVASMALAAYLASSEERAKRMANPGFGRIFTDHMVVVPYKEGQGWGRGVLQAYGPIAMDPAASVLHYGQAIFEGFKAYQQPDGGIACFRPEANSRRFNTSAARLALPELPEEIFLAAAKALITQDQAWVPGAVGESLANREQCGRRSLEGPALVGVGNDPPRRPRTHARGMPCGYNFTRMRCSM